MVEKTPIENLAILEKSIRGLAIGWWNLKRYEKIHAAFKPICEDIEDFFEELSPNWAENVHKIVTNKQFKEIYKLKNIDVGPEGDGTGLRGLGAAAAAAPLAAPAALLAALTNPFVIGTVLVTIAVTKYATDKNFRKSIHNITKRATDLCQRALERARKWKDTHISRKPQKPTDENGKLIGPAVISALNTAIVSFAAYKVTKEVGKTIRKTLSPGVFIAAAVVLGMFLFMRDR